MRKITLGQRLRYHFDNSLSGGTASLIGWLAVITLAMVLLATSVLVVMKWQPAGGESEDTAKVEEVKKDESSTDKESIKSDEKVSDKKYETVDDKTKSLNKDEKEQPKTEEKTEPKPDEKKGFSFIEGFWQSLMRSMDAGTVAGDPADDNGNGWAFRIWGLFVTFGGIFILSSLIGILTSGLEGKLEELRKGKSFVCEENHTLILGWSPRIFRVISELCVANANAQKPRVVILADKDKIEMEDEIRGKIEDTGKTKVVCRSGSPIDLDDLEIVNPHSTKSIIILSPEEFSDPDSQVIKMILAITNNPNRRPEPYHIVAELRDAKNIDVAKMVGRDEVEIVLPSELVSRITVQTSRQTGLSVVYKELLDFGGDEIYFKNESGVVGKTFGESISKFDDSCLIGIRSNGVTKLNPAMDTKINSGDSIVCIASDDDKIRLNGNPSFDEFSIVLTKRAKAEKERNLILGWNHKGETIIREMDNYVATGSELTVVSELEETKEVVEQISSELKNLTVKFQNGDTTDRKLLDAMDLTSYQHIILLCYGDDMEIQEADSKTLMTLLHLRDIESKKGEAYSVVSEMLDVKNRALAEVAKADDFIVSDELAGLLLTQVAENKELGKVFDDLFDADGAEIYLKPVTDFVSTANAVNFYTILEAAKRRNETAIGYRIVADANSAEKAYGVRVNPPKSSNITFSPDDKIIVLAES
ncbi:MAG: NAD-binding protein [Pyrinomonadaceae bacterium]|nr:NAD-binding protein [Pyrinomonadaceae bacterium]